jgi:hypothetical protein
VLPGVLTVAVPASAEQADAAAIQIAAAKPHGLSIIGTQGWRVLTSATAKDCGEKISAPGYPTTGWLQVKPDDAGAPPGTEINALVQNGKCPEVFYSDNMRKCFGYVDKLGPVTTDPFKDPWWYRTDFAPAFKPGQNAKLTIPGSSVKATFGSTARWSRARTSSAARSPGTPSTSRRS